MGQSSRSIKMLGNQNAAKGRPTKPDRERYPYDGYPVHCDGCHVIKCPKRAIGAVCAFRREFADLDTRDAQAVLQEMERLAAVQRGRVVRSLMVENLLNGGLNERATGREIERQARLLALIAHFRQELDLRREAPCDLSPDGIFAQLGLVKFLPQEGQAES